MRMAGGILGVSLPADDIHVHLHHMHFRSRSAEPNAVGAAPRGSSPPHELLAGRETSRVHFTFTSTPTSSIQHLM